MGYIKLSLTKLGGGVVEEILAEELKKVLQNIGDPNTKANIPRTIELKIKFKPSDDRSISSITCEVKSKLAPGRPFETMAVLSTDGENISAFENDMRQPDLPGIENRTVLKMEGTNG